MTDGATILFLFQCRVLCCFLGTDQFDELLKQKHHQMVQGQQAAVARGRRQQGAPVTAGTYNSQHKPSHIIHTCLVIVFQISIISTILEILFRDRHNPNAIIVASGQVSNMGIISCNNVKCRPVQSIQFICIYRVSKTPNHKNI